VAIAAEDTQKRFWFTGAHVEWTCPDCGREHKDDLDGDSINYPPIGKGSYNYGRVCDDYENCGFEGKLLLRFGLTVTADVK
jgi:hypothetical protein